MLSGGDDTASFSELCKNEQMDNAQAKQRAPICQGQGQCRQSEQSWIV